MARRARLRAFKCRMGVHRHGFAFITNGGDWVRLPLGACRDCGAAAFECNPFWRNNGTLDVEAWEQLHGVMRSVADQCSRPAEEQP
jgi:hypothetical protein